MMSLRSIARNAPRALARATSATSTIRTTSSTFLRTARPSTLLRPTQITSAFSTSTIRRTAIDEEGATETELASKLDEELKYETSVKETEHMPASIKDFLENSQFEIKDIPGSEDVILTRTYGNEKITVSFSISDLTNYSAENDFDVDEALGDEEGENHEHDNSTAAELDAEAEEDGQYDHEESIPCRLNIVIEKPNQGALSVEAVAQDGTIMVENFYYYKDAKVAHSNDANAAHAAGRLYPGPVFGSLDEDLQVLLERYLEERGITPALALFVPDYMDMKEQKEYISWLQNVKGFISA
ncbi:mitochondrial glycoprotein [Podospora fimiseda]|uniref:Mitochondrial glycoprotein n=1 Tax=Podospora fimiseda TaxID=252190 RepID=A0AAN7H252_9PEZI|nr:mitochondrial glycoprotein [Podospora fimiseda]